LGLSLLAYSKWRYRNNRAAFAKRIRPTPLPKPARYVIATGGRIRYANVNPDYTHRPEPEDLIPALKAEAARGAA
jgi:hypothetical protein